MGYVCGGASEMTGSVSTMKMNRRRFMEGMGVKMLRFCRGTVRVPPVGAARVSSS
jgi:hypothetical protein